MPSNDIIRWEQDGEFVVLVIDDPDQSVNTMNDAFLAALGETIDRLESEKGGVRGAIVSSGKPTFFAGGDLHELAAVQPEDSLQFTEHVHHVHRLFRRLETLGVPVVSVIAGAALGGGLELALATHRRIALDAPAVKLGLPEVTLGLLPGGGGVVRTVRMLGVIPALDQLLLKGQRLSAAQALDLGLVDELVSEPEELITAARAWLEGEPEPTQAWDRPGYRIPGGDVADLEYMPTLQELPAKLRKELRTTHQPAPPSILAAAVEGAQVDFESASRIETRYFVKLATSPEAKNQIQLFFDTLAVNGERPGYRGEYPEVGKAAVLGAGMMGSGIAYVCAKAGLDVVLKDVDLAKAERGREYSDKLVAKADSRGADPAVGRALLGRIKPSSEIADASGADLVIEAVFEDPEIKRTAMVEAEPELAPDALLASNTSTLPISDLAENVTRPEDFVGLHFFSPVDKMPLLEIIVGERTSRQTVGRALAFARKIRKTPIIVSDSRGFFTSRVIGTFLDEGIAMLAEGIPAATIEHASVQAGYPAPVLQLCDELNLNLLQMVRQAAKEAVLAEGGSWNPHPSQPVIDRMLDEFDRGGRLAGAGFYGYEDGKRTGLWGGLAEAFDSDVERTPPFVDLEERMLFIESLETIRCLDDGVIESIADANVGSILGIGFPRWTGGVLQYVNTYPGSIAGFSARAADLAERYGERFSPPQSLIDQAQSGEPYHDEPAAVAAAQ
jgi:3-hydroxyacyl-CoA dehydrogenase / enoyl-CoA hydratase / 3-hydroxybutyryl-CoA epimerase